MLDCQVKLKVLYPCVYSSIKLNIVIDSRQIGLIYTDLSKLVNSVDYSNYISVYIYLELLNG